MSSSKPAGSLRGYVALSVVWLAVLGVVLFALRRPAAEPIKILPPPSLTPASTSMPSPTSGPLRVDVAGAVLAPGVYSLPAGSIVADAIAQAGGPAAEADLDRLNKAARLSDGIQIYVPRVAETVRPPLSTPWTTPAPAAPATSKSTTLTPVDINTASAQELEALPEIGPAKAQRIIAGRPYSSVEDILRVQGIGEATLEKLRPFITVR